MADRLIKSETLQDIADALRERTEKTEKINPSKFAAEIRTLALDTSEPYDDSVTVDEGKTVTFNEDYSEGRNDVYAIVDPLNAELERTLYGTDTGGKSYYDEFWESAIPDLKAVSGAASFAGGRWNDKTFIPPQKITFTGNCSYCFFQSGIKKEITDLVEFGNGLTSLANTFYGCKIKTIPALNASGIGTLASTFYLSEAEKVILLAVSASTKYSSTFHEASKLKSLTIGGTIGQAGFDTKWSPLDKESLTSIVNALSTTTNGLTVTLSLNAVKKAFETSEGANDGDTSPEWLALAATKPNWTITLATV